MPSTPVKEALLYGLIAMQSATGTPVSIKRVQQLAYLAQNASQVPAGFTYRIRYGSPSSEDVYDTIATLSATAYINISDATEDGDLSRYLTIADEPRPRWDQTPTKEHPALQPLMDTVGDLTDRQLDAVASAHMTKEILSGRWGQKKPEKTDVTKIVKGMKPAYTKLEISAAYDVMESLQSFRATNDPDRNAGSSAIEKTTKTDAQELAAQVPTKTAKPIH